MQAANRQSNAKYPSLIVLRILKLSQLRVEARPLDRHPFCQTVHADDLTIRRLDQPPFGTAGEGVSGNPSKVTANPSYARISEKLIHRSRTERSLPRRRVHVAPERPLKRLPDIQQFLLRVSARLHGPNADSRCGKERYGRHEHQQDEQRHTTLSNQPSRYHFAYGVPSRAAPGAPLRTLKT